MSRKGEERARKLRVRKVKEETFRDRQGAPIRAPHMPTKAQKPRTWKQPKWHRDLFGKEMED